MMLPKLSESSSPPDTMANTADPPTTESTPHTKLEIKQDEDEEDGAQRLRFPSQAVVTPKTSVAQADDWGLPDGPDLPNTVQGAAELLTDPTQQNSSDLFEPEVVIPEEQVSVS